MKTWRIWRIFEHHAETSQPGYSVFGLPFYYKIMLVLLKFEIVRIALELILMTGPSAGYRKGFVYLQSIKFSLFILSTITRHRWVCTTVFDWDWAEIFQLGPQLTRHDVQMICIYPSFVACLLPVVTSETWKLNQSVTSAKLCVGCDHGRLLRWSVM